MLRTKYVKTLKIVMSSGNKYLVESTMEDFLGNIKDKEFVDIVQGKINKSQISEIIRYDNL